MSALWATNSHRHQILEIGWNAVLGEIDKRGGLHIFTVQVLAVVARRLVQARHLPVRQFQPRRSEVRVDSVRRYPSGNPLQERADVAHAVKKAIQLRSRENDATQNPGRVAETALVDAPWLPADSKRAELRVH